MKKHYFFTLFFLTFSLISFGQELLVNGDFESWDDTSTPTGWTKIEDTAQESTEIRGGTYSLKHTGGTSDVGQTITDITAGSSYTIIVWYKVEAGTGDETDGRIWSYWKDADGNNVTDENTDGAVRGPDNGYFDNNGNEWTEYTATVIAPETATQFYFELRTYGSAVIYYDDLSFFAEDSASIKDNIIEGFASYPNPATEKTVTISSASSDTKSVNVFNLIGKQVLTKEISGTKESIDLSELLSGIYILKVTEGSKTATKRLIIK